MNKLINVFSILALVGFSFSSCVSSKKYADMKNKYDECSQRADHNFYLSERKEADLDSANAALKRQVADMAKDTVDQSLRMHQIAMENNSLRGINDGLSAQLKASHNEAQTKALLADFQKIQEQLQAREDTLQVAEKTLKAKEKKVNELSSIIDKQNQTMQNLRQRVADALKGFEGNGLVVVNKNGKVYVSMDEKLLFQSGKWDVDAKADSALSKISAFLAANKDIQVVIEGHTDDLPFKGNGNVTDNWDLSAKRATAIVRALLKNGNIDPARISASGRAEFDPLDKSKTKEARQRNRRTEIILSPNMDELFNVINGK